ncbi:CPSF A subunit region-domain-containing protein [Emericellopsis atlantica]|uniref:Pre-mRNA-splicing factor RSE1 n=1 Tax=Emericellopsis atlantica TaxID=2614577 RepID=A0A9P8CU38_9HYPO|nr:CPSF A subunit region-domain-containing protein [Emericellopsis atlantica]KAG9257326.1 CPSF A subunit region-domain-containing protein [Emericellopsis atlantica]
MATTSNMFLYSLTVQPPSNVVHAVLGQFAGTKEQLIISGAGSRLTLLRPDSSQGKVLTVLSHDVFGIIRSLAAFRLAGSNKDYLIVATDSGRITIIEYQPGPNRFHRLHLETYGKSGVRRVIPGEYLACDPKGRACLVASVEKNKLVYVLNRNSQAELTISSPLEAHKPNVLVIAMVALDVGYANPVFAALEIDYSEVDQDSTGQAMQEVETQLVYYELDLGLNHVVRKWSEPVDPTASLLFQVPGGNDGPSGVLVCGEENITYRHSNQEAFRVPIPRRKGATEDPSRKRTIVSGVMHKLKGSAGAFFFLLQTEDGDLLKVTIDMVEDEDGNPTGEVRRLKVKYFDTVPVASNLCILKSGFLYVASQFGNYGFYQFEKLGDDDDELEFSSDDYPTDPHASYEPAYFYPRPAENLALVESIPAMNPLTDCKVANVLGEDAPQIFTVCGSGARSTFRMLKHGLEVNEIVASELPGEPSAVWTLKRHRDDQYDAYIVLSFSNGTLVLSIGETVEEVSDSGFLTSVPTLAAQLLGEDGLIQVHPKGIRHIRSGHVNEWAAPQHRSIVAASTNANQVAIALSSGEIVYFEMDSDGSLAEYDEKKEMFGTVTCLSLGEVPEGRLRSSFLAVGCDDLTVRIISLDPETTLENKSVQALTAAPTALSIMAMEDSASGGSTLYLHIGLHSGVYLRTVLDEVTGELTDTRQKFLGPKGVKLFQVTVQRQTCVLALSSRPWLGYSDPITKNFVVTPLNYVDLGWGWNFSSEQCEEGVVGIQGQSLRIFSIDRLGEPLIQSSVPLTYTPKKLVKHPEQAFFYTIEADNNVLPPDLRAQLLADPAAVNGDAKDLPPEDFGYPRGNRRWASCISVIDPVSDTPQVTQTIHLENNEAAVSVAVAPFASQDAEHFLIVGTGKDMVMNPRSFSEGYLHVYRFVEGGKELEFIHKTKMDEPPQVLLPFQGKILAGVGKTLRLYDLGLRQMLRKAQAEVVPQQIVSLNTQGNRIIVGDVQQGITYVVYKPATNKLIPYVDDTLSRWTTCSTMVDYESVAGGDKFGNMFIVRSPQKASEEADEEQTGLHLTNAREYLHGTSHRLNLMCHFYTQDIPTSITKTSLVVGGQDILLWSGIMGTIGVFIPFVSREDTDFFQSLEQHLRTEDPPLAGRDHLMYRGYYAPVKGVIDGDLCERYTLLPNDKKQMIAGELDRSVREIERKISDIRTRSAF